MSKAYSKVKEWFQPCLPFQWLPVGNIGACASAACHGAFAGDGIQEEMQFLVETELPDSRLSMANTSQDASCVEITSAQVVDYVILNATPLEGVPRIGFS
jgi:hypothetical protein